MSRPVMNKMKKMIRNPLIDLGLVAAAAVCGLVVLTVATEPVDGTMLLPELAKALVTVLAVALIGGGAKSLYDQQTHEREKREQQMALQREENQHEIGFIRSTITEAESIHSALQRARTVMLAHRSAKSYTDRMQDIIELQVRVEALSRSVQTRLKEDAKKCPEEVNQIQTGLEEIKGYLKRLIEEYQERYKRVSDLQRFDEAETDAQIKQYIRSCVDHKSEGSRIPRPQLDWLAWEALSDESNFSAFCDLRSTRENSMYKQAVDQNCTTIVRALMRILRQKLSQSQEQTHG